MSSIQSYTHPSTTTHIPTIGISPKTKSYILPTFILAGIVIASAVQTEFAHNLSQNLKYDKPYFTFYLTHSTFALIFPIHLIILRFTTGIPISSYLEAIRNVLINQLSLSNTTTTTTTSWMNILRIWIKKMIYLTLILSIPSISWYISMTLSPTVDITAIYSTSAFSTYGFSLWLLNQSISKITLLSIFLAFIGVIVISTDGISDNKDGMLGRVIGDLIMLFGAIILGLYEVIYKLALPEGHGGVSNHNSSSSINGYSALPTHNNDSSFSAESIEIDGEGDSSFSERTIMSIHHRPNFPHQGTDSTPTPIELTPPLSRTTSRNPINHPSNNHHHQTAKLPPALHANFITSCIGITTFLLLWPPIILLDWFNYESFSWPSGEHTWEIWRCLALVFAGGTVYNAGLMVLIGLWGPTTSSVANLLTIGLVALIDSIWLGEIPDTQTLSGVGMVCIGFGILLWEGEG
ncbi:uncharacterized protein L201_007906 [Kwoniella dendrophila CBS 6074]|uniref:EamA domain-containing protein n=1 Tax=Kwoniella dendrophila CBS 6074 TaxID=1295534 RepID=A0AAX4K789_9TREE